MFWEKYPNKTGKAAAHKAMLKVQKWKELIPKMIESLEWQMKSDKWTKDNGDYIPNPATWINQHRWEDEQSEAKISSERGKGYRKAFGLEEVDDATF